MSSTTVETRTGLVVWHDHVSDDPEAAKRFYGELLGWEFAVWEGGERPYSLIRKEGTDHGGFVEGGGGHAHWAAYVATEADAAAERARAAGGTIVVEPTDIPEVGRFAVVADPQGGIAAPFTPAYDSPPPAGAFLWDELVTSDVEAARSFYADVFGWGVTDMDMGEGGTYTVFTRGEQQVAGAMQKRGGEGGATWLSYLASEDVDADAERAVSLGATLLIEPSTTEGIGRSCVLRDPTGALFGLYKAA